MISTSFIVVQRGRGTVSNNLRFHENPWMEVNNSCTKRNRGTWWKNSCSVVGCISTEGVGGGGEEEEGGSRKRRRRRKEGEEGRRRRIRRRRRRIRRRRRRRRLSCLL